MIRVSPLGEMLSGMMPTLGYERFRTVAVHPRAWRVHQKHRALGCRPDPAVGQQPRRLRRPPRGFIIRPRRGGMATVVQRLFRQVKIKRCSFGRSLNVRDRCIPQRRVKSSGHRHQGRGRGERRLAGRGSCRRAGGAGKSGPPGHPGREARLPVVLADRAPFPAGRRGDEPEPAVHPDGDRRADQEDPAGPVRQYRRLASPGAHRRADRAARRDQRRARRMRHGPRLPAARERDPGPPVRLDDPGPGAQSQVVRGGGRDHPQVLDRAVVRRIAARTSRFRRRIRNGTTSRPSLISRWTRSSAGWRT